MNVMLLKIQVSYSRCSKKEINFLLDKINIK